MISIENINNFYSYWETIVWGDDAWLWDGVN